MKKFFAAVLFAAVFAGAAFAAPLDAFKGQKGKIDIAGGTAHIPVMKEAAKRIMTLIYPNPNPLFLRWPAASPLQTTTIEPSLVVVGHFFFLSWCFYLVSCVFVKFKLCGVCVPILGGVVVMLILFLWLLLMMMLLYLTLFVVVVLVLSRVIL